MFSGRWDHVIPKDRDGRLFLGLNPAWMEPMINHFRELVLLGPDDKLPAAPNVPAEHEHGYKATQRWLGLEQVLSTWNSTGGAIAGETLHPSVSPHLGARAPAFSSTFGAVETFLDTLDTSRTSASWRL